MEKFSVAAARGLVGVNFYRTFQFLFFSLWTFVQTPFLVRSERPLKAEAEVNRSW